MRGLRVLLGKHPWLGTVLVCLCVAGAWLAFAQTSSTYPPGTVEIEDIYDLEDWFRGQQAKFLPIMPPMDDPFMQTGYWSRKKTFSPVKSCLTPRWPVWVTPSTR